ncbi:hypothetical protein ACWEV3_41230 [Saccharopolyspora sp. NPDC003752]
MIEVIAARSAWCRPDERILWCTPLKKPQGRQPYVVYQVRGLDESGAKRAAGAVRALGAVGGFLAEAASEAISPGDAGSTSFAGPYAVITGGGRDCLAATSLASWQVTNANRADRNLLWFLTSHRLGLLEFESGKPETSASVGNVLSGLKNTVGRYVGGADEVPAEPAAEPELPSFTVQAEVPRSEIASMDVITRKLKDSKNLPFLRIALVDGSTIEVSDEHNEKRVQRMLAMSHGQE